MNALLLSGGIESTAIAYWLRPPLAVTIDYGQPSAAAELRAARVIAGQLLIKHECVAASPYPPRQSTSQPPVESRSIWWPYRNQLLITLAAAALSEREVQELQIGLVRGDIYKDCTDQFMRAVNTLFRTQERPIKVVAPARRLTTLELLRKSKIPYEMLGVTTSCHVAELPCGRCAGCQKSANVKQQYKARC